MSENGVQAGNGSLSGRGGYKWSVWVGTAPRCYGLNDVPQIPVLKTLFVDKAFKEVTKVTRPYGWDPDPTALVPL